MVPAGPRGPVDRLDGGGRRQRGAGRHRRDDRGLARACYLLIERIDFALVIPLAFGSLASGVVISLVTRWRLLRHWWVVVKFALTITVIVFSTFGVGVWVEQSIVATAVGHPSPVALPLIVGASGNLAAFLFMNWASITKPWSTTPWSNAATASGRSRRPSEDQ